MEAVKPKKSRRKEHTRAQGSSTVPSPPAMVVETVMQETPLHERYRAITPEPEEIVLPDDGQPSVSMAEESSVSNTDNALPLDCTTHSEESTPIVKTSSLLAEAVGPAIICYPSIPSFSEDIHSAYHAPLDYEDMSKGSIEASKSTIIDTPVVVDAPPLYPSAKLYYEKDEHGLLTEQQLLAFYYNPLCMTNEEFVKKFVELNLTSCGPIFPLLKRLKQLGELMSINEISDRENTEKLTKCLRDCWVVQQHVIESKGKCGENKEASGVAKFHKTVLCAEKVDALKNFLSINRTHLLDERLCQETQFQSTSLQVQWLVIFINQQFMEENGLSNHSSPTLLQTAVNSNGRVLLLNALSDLFYHLRFPGLPKRVVDLFINWIKELVCVLYMCCRCEDALFILNHLLRLPSPILEWAPPLVQTFIQAPSHPKVKVDYCITMLSHLLSPITARDQFLRQIGLSEAEDSTWTILSDDDEEGNFSLVTINECDLIGLFDQLPISELYSLAYLNFSSSAADKGDQFASLIAFQLLLMKVLDTGLSTYCDPTYKLFSKQIGNGLRQSVRELCNFWVVTRNLLRNGEDSQLQREVDRVVILAVQYIVNRPGFGLWQFLVDLPFACVTEDCRNRCEYLLRSVEKITLVELYDIPISELVARIRRGDLKERAEVIGPLDSVFLVNTIAAIASCSQNGCAPLVKEIIEMCFCDELSRESLYKVGGEAIALLLSRRPDTFDQLLTVLDRSMSHMDKYAVDVLASSNLSGCKLSPASLSILGKWLIYKNPDDSANRMARRIMSSVHWGPNEVGDQLWLDPAVHEISADTVMKAHSVHCGSSNGMIAKSIRQVSKLASRMPDHEHLFNQFCWDILIKVKFNFKEERNAPQNDLTAFFIHIYQSCLESVAAFLDRGVPLLNELVTAGCSTASVVLLARLMEMYYPKVWAIGSHKAFMEVFERILHVDQCSYAVQWLTGPSLVPTPIVRLICSSLSYYSKHVHDIGKYLRAWIELLCVRRPTIWNTDSATLQVLGSIVRIAFVNDSKNFLGIFEIIYNLYQQVLKSWRDNTRGILSMFTSEQAPPTLVTNSVFGIAPWATYLLLLVESKSYPTFYQILFETFVMKESITVEEACKRAASKSSLLLTTKRIAVYRWAEFVSVSSESTVFPLALQRLASESYCMRTVMGRKYCFARRFLDSTTAESVFGPCKKVLSEVPDPKGLAKAVSGWLFCNYEVTRSGFDFSVFDLDYLLQLILAEDTNVWVDFIDHDRLLQEESQDEKLYSHTCHMGLKDNSGHDVSNQYSNKSHSSRAIGFPVLPSHPGLPTPPVVEMNAFLHTSSVVGLVNSAIKQIHILSEKYAMGSDDMTQADAKFGDLVTKLHTSVPQQVPVQLRCGIRCASPLNTTAQVSGTEFNGAIDALMTQNREKRIALLNELHSGILDKMSVTSATMEHIARQLVRLCSMYLSTYGQAARISGRSVLKAVTSSLGGVEMLFPAATAAYEHTLRLVADGFVRMQSEEQIPLMTLVLEGFPLSDPLVEAFTPECLSSADLCSAYSHLSEAVRDSERSSRALRLLGRLGIDKAAAALPPQQFAPLIPLAFRNLASQRSSNSPLHILCLEHAITFVFHAFPSNFAAGLDIALDGCNTGETPLSLLQMFVSRLGADNYEFPKTDYPLNAEKATEYASLLARKLNDARSRTTTIYNVWGRYLDCITKLAQLFLYTPTRETYTSDAPSTVIEKDLWKVFQQTVDVFSPLIVPMSASLPPFSPSNEAEAHMVLDRFVQLLTVLPHSATLQPGTQNLPSLIWQFYFEKLSLLSHGSNHYFSIIESHFVRIPWSSFYPSQRGISAMDECLATRSQHCAPFIGQVVVRILWKDVLTYHVQSEIIPQYLSILYSVLVRIGSSTSNYIKVRASLLDLVKSLSGRSDWSIVSPENAEDLSKVVAVCFPHDSLTNPTDIIAVLHIIWRKICCFIVGEPFTSVALLKQTMWLRTECSLLLREGSTAAPAAYNSLIADVHSIAQQHENLRAFSVVVRELITLWSRTPDTKHGESLVTTWNAYLDANYESHLVLMSLNTLIGSLNADQLVTALKVLEKTIRSYFKRSSSSWEELMCWVHCPSNRIISVRDYLLNISNNPYPLMLTTSWFLRFHHPHDVVLLFHRFIISIKPKHVWCEASFVLLLWQEVRWLVDSVLAACTTPSQTPNDCLSSFMRWLNKAAKDDSSFITSFISSKKTSHSPRLRVILAILELYFTQQMMGEHKLPRTAEGAPVLNSRIHALKELAATKVNQQFAAAFNIATPFFVQVDFHHIGSTPSLVLQCSKTLYKEKFLSDV